MSNTKEGTTRGSFASHLGFILVAAGCSIGLGNVWRFPYITGQNGGAIFCLIYLLCLILLGLPLMTVELAIGRASRQSVSTAFKVLAPNVRRWNFISLISLVGKYVLLSFYGVITGWLLYYTVKIIQGDIVGLAPEQVSAQFGSLLGNPIDQFICLIVVLLISGLLCFKGISKGVERATKPAMLGMFLIVGFLAVYSLTMDGSSKGLDFYLKPNLESIQKVGFWTVVNNAMNQVFFSLSIGIGSISIFGSYIGKQHSIVKDSVSIISLDTLVAFLAGLIIFPVCFTYGVNADAGPTLIFQTMLNLFSQMPNGQLFGALFFAFLTIAALTTLVAVFEGIVADNIDYFEAKRSSSAIITFFALTLLSVPTILGFNSWSSFQPLGENTCIMDLMDFLISNNLLPLGALLMVVFCVSKYGWNWTGYIQEVLWGKKVDDNSKLMRFLKFYYKYCLTLIIGVIIVMGYVSKFA